MDTTALLSKLNQVASGLILEKQRFGRAGQREMACVWIEAKSVLKFARIVRDEAAIRMTWLENLTAMQLDESIVLSYFTRSHKTGGELVFRATIAPDTEDSWIEIDSVAELWPVAREYELEIRDLFGVRFKDPIDEPAARGRRLLPEGWKGFPLRKGYAFPAEPGGDGA